MLLASNVSLWGIKGHWSSGTFLAGHQLGVLDMVSPYPVSCEIHGEASGQSIEPLTWRRPFAVAPSAASDSIAERGGSTVDNPDKKKPPSRANHPFGETNDYESYAISKQVTQTQRYLMGNSL